MDIKVFSSAVCFHLWYPCKSDKRDNSIFHIFDQFKVSRVYRRKTGILPGGSLEITLTVPLSFSFRARSGKEYSVYNQSRIP